MRRLIGRCKSRSESLAEEGRVGGANELKTDRRMTGKMRDDPQRPVAARFSLICARFARQNDVQSTTGSVSRAARRVRRSAAITSLESLRRRRSAAQPSGMCGFPRTFVLCGRRRLDRSQYWEVKAGRGKGSGPATCKERRTRAK